ncbi:hypothetical protein AMATHDRAFT_171785 [Amanita thiersii Skay4041]|uniref:G-protein coupled receptors family 1 profile domain-containing protein n=1 Tax=Amanita thiersii Skay4041 TaxID=703135 RepID=A0A2A9NZ63_9AGAR|nr:hypothetical protein AMATHDRAFT_171785 [Amanita thiersii Skay4041]
MVIPVATAELVGTFLEMLGYGVYLVIYPQAILALRRKKLEKSLMIYLYATMVISFCLITLHLVVDLIRAFIAFTSHMSEKDFPEKFYANVNTRLNLMKNSTVVCTTLISDTLLLYRTLIVWGRNYWVLVVPVMLYFLDIAMSIWFTWSITEAEPGNSVLISSALDRSKYFFAATLAVNLLCTVLIAYRIWHIQRAVTGYRLGQRRAQNALYIVLESAAIYTIVLVCLIGTACADSSTVFFFLNSLPPIIGAVFIFVILRSSSDIKRFNTTTINSSSNSAFRRDTSRVPTNEMFNMKPVDPGVRVHLETFVHQDKGSVTEQIEPYDEIHHDKVDNTVP